MNLPSNESGILAMLDAKLSHLSLKNLLNNLGRNEEKDTFVSTFSAAYSKIVDYERPQMEFKKMFSVSRITHNSHHHHHYNSLLPQQSTTSPRKSVKYISPVQDFIQKYGGYFPVNTIFSSFPS